MKNLLLINIIAVAVALIVSPAFALDVEGNGKRLASVDGIVEFTVEDNNVIKIDGHSFYLESGDRVYIDIKSSEESRIKIKDDKIKIDVAFDELRINGDVIEGSRINGDVDVLSINSNIYLTVERESAGKTKLKVDGNEIINGIDDSLIEIRGFHYGKIEIKNKNKKKKFKISGTAEEVFVNGHGVPISLEYAVLILIFFRALALKFGIY